MLKYRMLDMLNRGLVDDVKKQLKDEIFQESLKTKPNAKKRYAAMKKYLSYEITAREALKKPASIDFNDKNYISFCNAHSIVLTTEPCGELDLSDDPTLHTRGSELIRYDGTEGKIDFTKVFAEAKSKGYKLKKSELFTGSCKYIMKYNGAYFNLGLIDISYKIIDDGQAAKVYHNDNARKPLVIETEIGVCLVMPINGFNAGEDQVVIEA